MLQDYLWLILTTGIASILYGLKLWDTQEYKTKWELFRKVIYGMGGSAFVVLIVYHLCMYYGMSENASLALGGACGYLGAESLLSLVQKFLDRKINS